MMEDVKKALFWLALKIARMLAEKGDIGATAYPDEVHVEVVPTSEVLGWKFRREVGYLGVVFATDEKEVLIQSIRVNKGRYGIG